MMYVHGNTDTAYTISPLPKLILISDVQHDFIYIDYIISHNIWNGIWLSECSYKYITMACNNWWG